MYSRTAHGVTTSRRPQMPLTSEVSSTLSEAGYVPYFPGFKRSTISEENRSKPDHLLNWPSTSENRSLSQSNGRFLSHAHNNQQFLSWGGGNLSPGSNDYETCT